MSKFMRTLLAVLGIGALMLTLVVYKPAATSAANLTGGNYTYVINGEEETFTFDPVVRQGGLLLPTEVFERFDITIDGPNAKDVVLSKQSVSAKVTVGSTGYLLNGQAKTVSTAPLRLNGRLFLPSDLLKEFGIDFSQDGNYVVMRNFSDSMPEPKTLTDSAWGSLRASRGFSATIKSDSGAYMTAEFSLLNADMINATNLNITFGNRARLLGMLQTNSLVLVKLSNQSNKSGGLVTTGTYLVDNLRNEYDVASVVDVGYGLLNSKLAPGADRYGVLAYPKLVDGISMLTVYYDNNGVVIGNFPSF